MQSYPLNLPAGGAATTINAAADLFVYESGTATPTTGDTRIAIKSDNGSEIILRPGQRVRMPEKASRWSVQAYDKVTAIAGFIIIGSGEFDDANTINKFTLDATFANNVAVTNTPANRVPVTLDTTQLLKLDPATTVNIAGNTVNYTNSFANSDNTVGSASITVFAPAANPNGAYIELAEIASFCQNIGSAVQLTLSAKISALTSENDGDVIMTHANGQSTTTAGPGVPLNDKLGARVKIPAGKGLYFWQSIVSGSNVARKTVLYTLL